MTKLEDKIKKTLKSTKPRSGRYFLVEAILKEAVVIALWFVCVGLLGAIIYILQNYPWRVFAIPRFFLRGLVGLPWELIALASLLAVGVYFLTKNISTFYRYKMVLIIALMLSLIGGYIIAETTGLNQSIAETRPIRPLYQHQGRLIAPERMPAVIGEIQSVQTNHLEVLDDRANTWKIIYSEKTKIDQNISIGKRVVVIGEKSADSIEASEIRSFGGPRGMRGGKSTPGLRPMY